MSDEPPNIRSIILTRKEIEEQEINKNNKSEKDNLNCSLWN